jgi:hypothetical protein
MDLYVKLYGLKHNFRKVLGCFCKITGFHEFLELTELFFYRKSGVAGVRFYEPSPWSRCTGLTTSLNVSCPRLDQRSDLIRVLDFITDGAQRPERWGRRATVARGGAMAGNSGSSD